MPPGCAVRDAFRVPDLLSCDDIGRPTRRKPPALQPFATARATPPPAGAPGALATLPASVIALTRTTMKIHYVVPAALAIAAAASPAWAGKTLDAVKARGQLVCGVNTSGPGFSNADSQGKW